MFFFKRCYVNVGKDIDVISIINELKYALRDSKAPDGLLSAVVPVPGAGLVIMPPIQEAVDELKASLDVFGGESGKAKDRLKRERGIGPIIQSAILGRTVHIPFQEGELLLDPYDEVLLIDFDDKKGRREFVVQVISETPQEKPEQPEYDDDYEYY